MRHQMGCEALERDQRSPQRAIVMRIGANQPESINYGVAQLIVKRLREIKDHTEPLRRELERSNWNQSIVESLVRQR